MNIWLIILAVTQFISILMIIDHHIALKAMLDLHRDYQNREWLSTMEKAGAEIVYVNKEEF